MLIILKYHIENARKFKPHGREAKYNLRKHHTHNTRWLEKSFFFFYMLQIGSWSFFLWTCLSNSLLRGRSKNIHKNTSRLYSKYRHMAPNTDWAVFFGTIPCIKTTLNFLLLLLIWWNIHPIILVLDWLCSFIPIASSHCH